MIRVLKKLRGVLSNKQKRFLYILILLMIVGGFLESLSVSIILPLIETIMNSENWNQSFVAEIICGIFTINDQISYIIILLVILIVLFIFKNIYLLLEYFIQFSYLADGRYKLQTSLLKHYLHKPYSFYLYADLGEIVRIMNSDSNDAFIILNHIITIFTDGIICIILGITIFAISPIIASDLTIVLLLEIVIISLIVKPLLKRVGERRRKESAKANKWMLQSINGIKSIKVSRCENFFYDKFDFHTKVTVDAERKNQTVGVMPRLIIESVTVAAVLMLMLIAVLRGENVAALLPQLSAFVVAALKLLPGINRISAAINAIPFYEGGLDNTLAVINDNRSEENREVYLGNNQYHKEVESSDSIVVEELDFSYSEDTRKVLDNINLNLKLGKFYGIVGSSGAGKTTFVDVLLGILSPTNGGVFYQNKNIQSHLDDWLLNVAYIPQQIFLMDASIKDNVVFGDEYDENKLWNALKQAQIDEVVRSLSMGLDTIVGEQGIRLSGGQRQRIGIARAIYKNPKILFFDEATSALDNETEEAVMQTINSLKGEKTIIIIAHRLSTIDNCDEVYRVEHGKIVRER